MRGEGVKVKERRLKEREVQNGDRIKGELDEGRERRRDGLEGDE